ncbi:hypothetical protein VINE108274_17130 [Vibrio neptunius]
MVGRDDINLIGMQSLDQGISVAGVLDRWIAFNQVASLSVVLIAEPQMMYTRLGCDVFLLNGPRFK